MAQLLLKWPVVAGEYERVGSGCSVLWPGQCVCVCACVCVRVVMKEYAFLSVSRDKKTRGLSRFTRDGYAASKCKRVFFLISGGFIIYLTILCLFMCLF